MFRSFFSADPAVPRAWQIQKQASYPFIGFILLCVNHYGMSETKAHPAGKQVKLETSLGEIILELYGDMPVNAGNFQKLVSSGFYNEIIFHRVIDVFMIRGRFKVIKPTSPRVSTRMDV